MYNQTYEDEAPLPLIANYTEIKEDEEEKAEDRVILEIGRQDDKNTFSHKKYDKTISHHRSYILDDYEPRRVTYFRPHEIEHGNDGIYLYFFLNYFSKYLKDENDVTKS